MLGNVRLHVAQKLGFCKRASTTTVGIVSTRGVGRRVICRGDVVIAAAAAPVS
jgi:hypothetical protein